MAEQNYSNHVRWVPTFHFFVVPILLGNVGVQLYWWFKSGFALSHIFTILVALALLVGIVGARVMTLHVQDRVIRLEERQRMALLLPEDFRPRIGEFTTKQLVALRYASDEELPALARKVLNDKLTNVKAIKQMVQHWRGDYLRA
jgi:Family of unknown function (DUF6526)